MSQWVLRILSVRAFFHRSFIRRARIISASEIFNGQGCVFLCVPPDRRGKENSMKSIKSGEKNNMRMNGMPGRPRVVKKALVTMAVTGMITTNMMMPAVQV